MADNQKLAKLFRIALHPATTEAEALSAIRRAASQMEKLKIEVDDLVDPTRVRPALPNTHLLDLSLAMNKLREENEALVQTVTTLQGQIDDYKAQGLKPRKKQLVIGTRSGWSIEDRAALAAAVLEDPSRTNKELADLMASKFGRPVTENAIKGMKTRLDLHRQPRTAA